MRKTIVLTAAVLAALVLGTGNAGADIPGGNGLVSFGTFQCGALGDVEVTGPRPPQVPAGFTDTGQKFVMLSLTVAFTSTSGDTNVITKAWGTKAGLATVTCTQHFEEPGEGSGDATAVIAVVPPR
ncbi:MAG TPA: hypothetical protein VFN44_19655 [Solirubrobacteraceae bacterium]|nr:hypothetical protein [Solirubrobacteraceae bacterium]